MSQRSIIASATKTLLDTLPSFVTIKVTSNIDDKYPYDLTSEQLPAIKVAFADEGMDYKPSRRAMNKVAADFYLYSLEWDKDSTTAEEALLKEFRDILGTNLTISGTAVDISFKSIIKIETMYPLVMYKINSDILYEGSIENV